MNNKNKTIVCVDCSQEFELTDGWIKLMEENSEIVEPKRCHDCRKKRKRERETKNFNREY